MKGRRDRTETPEMDEPDDDSAEESDFIEGMGFVPPEEFTRKHLAFDDLSNVKVFDWPDDPLTRRIE